MGEICCKELLLGLLLLVSCHSDFALQGWQEGVLGRGIERYVSQDADLAVRFYYQRHNPQQSRAEITSSLLPGVTLYAVAGTQAGVQAGSSGASQQDFFFPLELQEAIFLLAVEGKIFEFRYRTQGSLALTRDKADDPYFNLERLEELEFGSLLSVALLDSVPVDHGTEGQEGAGSTGPIDPVDPEDTVKLIGETETMQEKTVTAEAEEQNQQLSSKVRQDMKNLEFFASELFRHRLRNLVEEPAAEGNLSAVNTFSPPRLPMLLVGDQWDDVLAAYFFPETLDKRQQQLLDEDSRRLLQKTFGIVWGGEESYTSVSWSREYSAQLTSDLHFQELRNSGRMWQQYRKYKNILQTLYNLRYVSSSAILQRQQLKKTTRKQETVVIEHEGVNL